MPELRTILRSFGGGELSPDLRGRFDDARYATGVRRMRNFRPSQRGPAIKRRGFAHVDDAHSNARMQLVPYRFSGEENLVVGIAAGFFRWFAAGAAVLFAAVRRAASIDTATDEFTFDDPHGFVGSESVRVMAIDPGGAEPAPLDDVTEYTVEVVDAWRLRLTGQDLTTVGAGAIRIVPADQVPPTYISSRNALEIDLVADEIEFATAHGMTTGQPVAFSTSFRLPVGILAGQRYFAIALDATTIRLALTAEDAAAGNAVPLDSQPVLFDGGADQVLWAGNSLRDNNLILFQGAGVPSGVTPGAVYHVCNRGLSSFQLALSPGGVLVSMAANVVTWTGHQLFNDTRVAFAGGSLPAPLVAEVPYYVVNSNIGAGTFQLATTIGGTAITFGSGGGTSIAVPIEFESGSGDAQPVFDLDGVASQVNWLLHGLLDDTPVTFGGPSLAFPLTAGATYYVVNAGLNDFQVSATVGGAPILFANGTASVTPIDARVHAVYEVGEQVYLRTVGRGFYVCTQRDPRDNAPPNTSYWHRLPDDGELEFPNPYAESELLQIDHSSTDATLVLAHENHDQGFLTRLAATRWKFETASSRVPLDAPTSVSGSAARGARVVPEEFDYINGNVVRFRTSAAHGLGNGEAIYVEGFGSEMPDLGDGYYVVALEANQGNASNEFSVRTVKGNLIRSAATSGTLQSGGSMQPAGLRADRENTYVVSAVNNEDVESSPSAEITVENDLLAPGARNTLTWSGVDGATRYRVYKRKNTLFGLIGETDGTSFVDDSPGIAPEFDVKPPIVDESVAGGKPRAVAHHGERRAFGGFVAAPQRAVLSRVGSVDDFSRHLPLQSDDRISVDIRHDGSTVRHLMSMPTGLLMLTSSSGHMAEPYGDQALEPENINRRLVSDMGAGEAMPIRVGSHAIFVADCGGRVLETQPRRQPEPTVDLSVRANHLVDGFDIVQLAFLKNPEPMVFGVRSDGALVMMSYNPTEQVLGWALFETGGVVESACGIPDGACDSLYVVVNRDGVRRVERWGPDELYLDDGAVVDGANLDTARTVTITEGLSWGPADTLRVTVTTSVPVSVGDFFEVAAADGTALRVTVDTVIDATNFRGRTDTTIPEVLRGVATSSWALGRSRVRTHLVSTEVTVKVDGKKATTATTDASGWLTLPVPAVRFQWGRRYVAELVPLPLTIPQDLAGGRGLTWNLNNVFAGIVGGEFKVGPREGELDTRTPEADGETRLSLPGSWTEGGDLVLQSVEPEELEVRYMALEVVLS